MKNPNILSYRFLNSKINEFYLELGVLTKNVTVMHKEIKDYIKISKSKLTFIDLG